LKCLRVELINTLLKKRKYIKLKISNWKFETFKPPLIKTLFVLNDIYSQMKTFTLQMCSSGLFCPLTLTSGLLLLEM